MELIDGRYQIKKVLGKGGFGKTFLAEDKGNSSCKTCVVKQLQPIFSEPYLLKKAKDLFNREAETLEILGKHPNIPTLFAYFEENNEFYIVQEYIAGHTLARELIPHHPLSEQQVISILREILEILQFVHQHNVIHRDIKPSNLIRRKQDNKLVLIDFGSVKKVTTAGSTKGTIVGSYAYIPEEQFQGKPNFCSDLYAVGMIAIQAITGMELKQMLGAGFPLNKRGEILWQKYAKVSHKLAHFLSKMVRNDYRKRYQSVQEAIQALDKIQDNQIIANIFHKINNRFLISTSKMIVLGGILMGIISATLIIYIIAKKQQLSFSGELTESSLTPKDVCQDVEENFYCKQYFFSGKKGQKIIIEMLSEDFDPYLILLKDDNSKLAVNDNVSIYNWNAEIVVDLPQDGKYILIARNSDGALGKYRLKAIRQF